MTNQIPETETQAAFARRLGVSRQYVQKLKAQGLPLTKDGQVQLEPALKWVRANVSTGGNKEAEPTLAEARTQLVLLQVERTELEIEKLRGSTVDREFARKSARAFARSYRDHMLRFASRYGPEIAAELGVEPGPMMTALDEAMHKALVEAAENPMPFAEALKLAAEE